jgi:Leucine-rich repeat (LRR) protein
MICLNNLYLYKYNIYINMHTLQYRLYKCKNNNYLSLDLCGLDLFYIPNIKNHPDYENIIKIEHLFLNSNNISTIFDNDIKQFKYLKVLDIGYNNLTNINHLPNSLNELVCRNNYLINICELNNLIKLDCSFNKIDYLNNYDKLEILDCSYTYIKKINFKKLKKICCNDSRINDISGCNSIEQIEMINSCINKLYYYDNLKKIIFSNNDNFLISKKYKIKNKDEYDNIITLIF